MCRLLRMRMLLTLTDGADTTIIHVPVVLDPVAQLFPNGLKVCRPGHKVEGGFSP